MSKNLFNRTQKTVLSLSLSIILATFVAKAFAVDPYNANPNDYSNNGQYGSQNLAPLQSSPQQAPLQGRVVTAPAGSYMTGSLQQAISSEYSHVGDRFNVTLNGDLAAGGSVILPAGSQLEAQVVSVTKAGHAGKNGQLDLRFTTAVLPNGQRVPLSGKLQTSDGTGLIRGGSTSSSLGRAALNTGIGAGLGAALGTAMGPLSGGGVGRGAIYGTALGGGVGVLSAAWQKGHDAVVPAGQSLNIVLDQPLTVTPSSGGGGYGQNYAPQPYGSNNQPYGANQPYGQNTSPNPYGYDNQ